MNENDLIYSFAREHVILASGLVALMVPQTLGAGIAVKGLDGRYQLGNSVMQKLLGKRFERITGLTDTELFPPEVARQLHKSDQNIQAGTTTSSDSLDFFRDGERVQCLLFKFPVHGSDGRLLFIGVAMLDTARLDNLESMQKSLESLQHTN